MAAACFAGLPGRERNRWRGWSRPRRGRLRRAIGVLPKPAGDRGAVDPESVLVAQRPVALADAGALGPQPKNAVAVLVDAGGGAALVPGVYSAPPRDRRMVVGREPFRPDRGGPDSRRESGRGAAAVACGWRRPGATRPAMPSIADRMGRCTRGHGFAMSPHYRRQGRIGTDAPGRHGTAVSDIRTRQRGGLVKPSERSRGTTGPSRVLDRSRNCRGDRGGRGAGGGIPWCAGNGDP